MIDPAVVACALMMHFDHERCSDIEAKSKFGVAATTDVRPRWVRGKLAQLLRHDRDVGEPCAILHQVEVRKAG